MTTDIVDRLNDPETCVDAIDDAIAMIRGVAIFNKEAMEDIEWAAQIVEDHVTKSKPAQEALMVKAHKESLSRLHRRLEKLVFAMQGVLDGY